MALNVRAVFVTGIAAYIFTRYYLERQMDDSEIFWAYSLGAALLGLIAALTVVSNHPSRVYFIPLAVISITLATLYYQAESPAVPESS